MAFKHPSDPQAQWDLCSSLGKLVAQDIVSAEDVLPGLFQGAIKGGFKGDESGLQLRLAWHLSDIADHWCLRRDRIEYVIRRETAPMLEALADGQEILRTAHEINLREGQPLLQHEVRGIVEASIAALLSKLRQRNTPNRRRRHAR